MEHYLPEVLSDDVQHLIAATGTGPVVLVGHDLGALLAYVFAMRYPALVARLVILNCPHPERWVPHARLELVDAGHWVHLDRPDRVNRVLACALGLT